MKQVIAFAGSNSKNSINKKLAALAANKIANIEHTIIDLNDYLLPIYGIDEEQVNGFPKNAVQFNELLKASDGIILSLAEHNGSYSAVFKNLFDWLSRIDKHVWKNKPMLLMSASPGGRGGASVMNSAKSTFPHLGGNIVATYSLPLFSENFSENTILDKKLYNDFLEQVTKFEKTL